MISNEYVNRAIDYILDHMGENISVEEVADYCHFSKFYFSRMFKMVTGESIYAFIKRVKLEQSAFRLKVERSRSITDISSDYGYSSSNYSSVFKQHHNTSPIEFRRNILHNSLEHPFYKHQNRNFESYEECNSKITIKTLDDYCVLYERCIGNYKDLSSNWEIFTNKYKQYITDETTFFERTYDDPSITDVDTCLYDIYMSIDKKIELENKCVLKGGKFAVYNFKGYVQQLYFAYQSIFNVWLPKSGYTVDERYGYDIYRVVDCPSMYMEIDICIPIK